MRIIYIALVAAAAPTPILRGAQEAKTGPPREVEAEDRLAYYESRARESFKEFKGKMDSYVSDFNENETVAAVSKNAQGFYKWAVNRDKWEAVAIFVAVGLIIYTIATILYRIVSTFCEVACLPIRCLTCCCRRRRNRYH